MNSKPQPTPAPMTRLSGGTNSISMDPLKLHPIMRDAAAEVIRQCEAEAIPFRLFEGWRSPQRQAVLYAQGRQTNHPGPIITRAKPWESYHQFGLASDFVLFINDKWIWDDVTYPQYWARLVEIGEIYGLEPLHFEKPHLQIAHLELADLQAGKYPGGGDLSWNQTLEAALGSYPINTIFT